MSNQQVDTGKRRFLIAASSAVGAAAVVGVATPFVMSFFPSERAKAAGAPVEVDISKLEPGMKIDVEWRGKVVWVVKRTPEMLAGLKTLDGKVADPGSKVPQQPEYAQNDTRSRSEHKEILVVVGLCTHLGCSPTAKMAMGAASGMGDDWKGGFFCPCHGSKFDMAGRVYAGSPAPINLEVPPHVYLADSRILVGVDKKEA